MDIIEFTADCELELIEPTDCDCIESRNERFKSGEAFTTKLDHFEETADIQFLDGSVALNVSKELFKVAA